MKTAVYLFKKMKRSQLLLVCGLMFFAVSCVDLEQPPLSFKVPEKREPGLTLSLDEIKNAANALQLKLYGGNYGYNTRIMAMNLGGDDIESKKDQGRLKALDGLGGIPTTGNNDIPFFWGQMYGMIQPSSAMIMEGLRSSGITRSQYDGDSIRATAEFNIEKYLEIPGLDQDSTMMLLGEAYFFRALGYFTLARFWGDVPCFADHTNKTGINGELAKEGQIPRTPVKDIYEKMILRDLKLAVAMLPEKSRSGTTNTPSKWAAKALLADVYITMAGWPLKQVDRYGEAAEQCKDIILQGGFSLTPSYADLWKEVKKTETNEHIFAIHHCKGCKPATASNYGMSYYLDEEGGGWYDYVMDSSFYERYPNDRRKNMIALNVVTIWDKVEAKEKKVRWTETPTKSPPIAKFRDYGGITSAQSDGITAIYRYAQVLLMYAEASNQAEGSPNALAVQCVQDVQKRASADGQTSTLPNGSNKEQFDKAVFDELGWEFAIEGKRWFQLVRKEKVVAQNQFNKRIKAGLDQRSCQTEQDAQQGQGYLMPLPSDEIEKAAASGVILTQNPGY